MKSLLFVAMSIKIARDYKPKIVEKHFSEITKLSRAEARQIKAKQQNNYRILFGTTYNLLLPNMRSLIKKHLLSCILIVILNTYFRFLREMEILKKYYLHHCILKTKIKINFMS